MKKDNWASVRRESVHNKEKRICEKFIREFPKEIDMYKLRTGKTIYFFTSKERMENKMKELDEYDYAEPGQKLTL